MSVPTNDSLDWMALQYVLGELSAADCDAFEERLARDLDACEAVTNASRVVQTARAALTTASGHVSGTAPVAQPSLALSHGTSRRSRIAFVGTAVAVCVVLGLFIVHKPNSVQSPDLTAELVSLWRTGVPGGESEDVDSDLADRSDDLANANSLNVDLDDGDADTEHEDGSLTVAVGSERVPRWMLAAVSIEVEASFEHPSEKVQEN